MLECKGISAGYGKEIVLRNVSAVCPSGKITVIIGPNGSGKSTFLRVCADLICPAAGEVYLGGRRITELSPQERAKQLAYLPQVRDVPDLTVGRLVLHGRFPHMSFPKRYSEEDWRITGEVLRETGLWELRERSLRTLSGGQRQKAYLAMALSQQSDVLLLDEPSTFLDIAHQLELLSNLRSLADSGKTVVAILHDLPAAMDTADQIILFSDGVLAAAGTPEDIFSRNVIPEVFGIRFGRVAGEQGWIYYSEKKEP